MACNFFHDWIDELSDESILYIVDGLWEENDFDRSSVTYLRKCFKNSRRVYKYYMTYVVIGD